MTTRERRGDRVRLRFSFEASSLRQAADLTAELRALTRGTVRVRPAPRRLRTAERWIVALETLPAPLAPAVLQHWESMMREVTHGHPDCRLIGWEPVDSHDPRT